MRLHRFYRYRHNDVLLAQIVRARLHVSRVGWVVVIHTLVPEGSVLLPPPPEYELGQGLLLLLRGAGAPAALGNVTGLASSTMVNICVSSIVPS